MALKQTIGNFLRGAMVIIAAVSFALFLDMFVIDMAPKNSDDFVKMISAQNSQEYEAKILKNRHERYMSEGISTDPAFAHSNQVTLPIKKLARNLPSSEIQEPSYDAVATARPSMTQPVLSPEKERRVADFGVEPAWRKPAVDEKPQIEIAEVKPQTEESKIEDLALIQPASGAADMDMAIIKDAAKVEEPPKPVKTPDVVYTGNRPRIVIIIDDMGVSPAHSSRVENLPAPLTLAYLPYAKDLPARTKRAAANGHELMVHMPMQPMNTSIDGGPKVLKVGQGDEEFDAILEWGLSQFDGFVGVNNHMGSRLTKDSPSMKKVMAALAKRDVYFIDSKTIGSSVAAHEASSAGLQYAERDVFLDHVISDAFVANALQQMEVIARRKGYAIAIGHPHPQTIKALASWLPTLAEKGFDLVPASQVVKRDARFQHVAQQ